MSLFRYAASALTALPLLGTPTIAQEQKVASIPASLAEILDEKKLKLILITPEVRTIARRFKEFRDYTLPSNLPPHHELTAEEYQHIYTTLIRKVEEQGHVVANIHEFDTLTDLLARYNLTLTDSQRWIDAVAAFQSLKERTTLHNAAIISIHTDQDKHLCLLDYVNTPHVYPDWTKNSPSQNPYSAALVVLIHELGHCFGQATEAAHMHLNSPAGINPIGRFIHHTRKETEADLISLDIFLQLTGDYHTALNTLKAARLGYLDPERHNTAFIVFERLKEHIAHPPTRVRVEDIDLEKIQESVSRFSEKYPLNIQTVDQYRAAYIIYKRSEVDGVRCLQEPREKRPNICAQVLTNPIERLLLSISPTGIIYPIYPPLEPTPEYP